MLSFLLTRSSPCSSAACGKTAPRANTAPVHAFIEKSKGRAQTLRAANPRISGDGEEEGTDGSEGGRGGRGRKGRMQTCLGRPTAHLRAGLVATSQTRTGGSQSLAAAGPAVGQAIPENAVESVEVEDIRAGVANLDTQPMEEEN